MVLIEELNDPAVPILRACDALGVSRATVYRSTGLPSPPQWHPRAPSPRRLSDTERAVVLDALHSPEFADQPPHEVYATLLSRGLYLASIRTMYRLLAERGETQERRNQRRPLVHTKPADRDGTESGVDVGHHQVGDDSRRRVPACVRHHRSVQPIRGRLDGRIQGMQAPGRAAICRDHRAPRHRAGVNGPCRSRLGNEERQFAQLLATLGVERSLSRPHVSDDNAFSEAQFKTLKYQPDYPGRFLGEVHARGWLAVLWLA